MTDTEETHPSSIFDSVKAHSNCGCSFCWAVWEMVERDSMDDQGWLAYAGHLTAKHGWVEGEGEL